jgi:hypothetical protein
MSPTQTVHDFPSALPGQYQLIVVDGLGTEEGHLSYNQRRDSPTNKVELDSKCKIRKGRKDNSCILYIIMKIGDLIINPPIIFIYISIICIRL